MIESPITTESPFSVNVITVFGILGILSSAIVAAVLAPTIVIVLVITSENNDAPPSISTSLTL